VFAVQLLMLNLDFEISSNAILASSRAFLTLKYANIFKIYPCHHVTVLLFHMHTQHICEHTHLIRRCSVTYSCEIKIKIHRRMCTHVEWNRIGTMNIFAVSVQFHLTFLCKMSISATMAIDAAANSSSLVSSDPSEL